MFIDRKQRSSSWSLLSAASCASLSETPSLLCLASEGADASYPDLLTLEGIHRNKEEEGKHSQGLLELPDRKEIEGRSFHFYDCRSMTLEEIVARTTTSTIIGATLKPQGGNVVVKSFAHTARDERTSSFHSEYTCLGLLKECPNVVDLLGWGFAGSRAVLVLEWIHGVPLREWLENPIHYLPASHVHLQLLWRIQWAKQMAATVAHLHSRRIVHGDIKPENLIVRSNVNGTAEKPPDVVFIDFSSSTIFRKRTSSLSFSPNHGKKNKEEILNRSHRFTSDSFVSSETPSSSVRSSFSTSVPNRESGSQQISSLFLAGAPQEVTPSYLPPEAFSIGEGGGTFTSVEEQFEAMAARDMWSLGVVFLELFGQKGGSESSGDEWEAEESPVDYYRRLRKQSLEMVEVPSALVESFVRDLLGFLHFRILMGEIAPCSVVEPSSSLARFLQTFLPPLVQSCFSPIPQHRLKAHLLRDGLEEICRWVEEFYQRFVFV